MLHPNYPNYPNYLMIIPLAFRHYLHRPLVMRDLAVSAVLLYRHPHCSCCQHGMPAAPAVPRCCIVHSVHFTFQTTSTIFQTTTPALCLASNRCGWVLIAVHVHMEGWDRHVAAQTERTCSTGGGLLQCHLEQRDCGLARAGPRPPRVAAHPWPRHDLDPSSPCQFRAQRASTCGADTPTLACAPRSPSMQGRRLRRCQAAVGKSWW